MKTRAALALLALCLGALPARADDAEQKARVHYGMGQARFKAGRYDEAIAEYEAAYALVHRPELLFNIGSAYRKKASVTRDPADKRAAIAYYQRYLDATPSAKAAHDATTYIASLTQELDEEEPPERPLAPTPEPAVLPPPPLPPPPAPRDAGRPRDGHGLRVAGIVTAGAGGVALLAGVYFGLHARSIAGEVATTYSPGRDADGRAANRNFIVFTAAGAAAMVAGGVLYYLGRQPADRAVTALGPRRALRAPWREAQGGSRSATHFTLLVAPGLAGIALVGSF